MDKYSVVLTNRAVKDLERIYAYIAGHLTEPGTALELVDRIERDIVSLEQMPNRCPLRRRGAYAGKGYRQMLVGNYTAIFRVDEAEKQVIVVTIHYARRGK